MSHVRDLLAQDRDELNVTQRRRVDEHLVTCGDCRGLQADLARSDRLLSVREPEVPIPHFDRLERPRERATPLLLAGVGAIALLAILVLAPVLGMMTERAAGPTPTGLPVPTERTSPSPAPSAPAGFTTHESPILGYRLTLPNTYRRVGSSLSPGHPELLGRDTYTTLTESEVREECLRDGGGIPSRAAAAYLNVEAYRTSAGTTALEWARSRPQITRSTVEPATIDGREAARVVGQDATHLYVMRANDRMYVLTPAMWPTPHQLDDIAATFRAITPQPLPSPTPTAANPRDAAATLARTLTTAFAARDTDAIAALITPNCSIGVWTVVEPVQLGSESCCVLNRAVAPFLEALRDRFTSGDLSVTVDPEVQVRAEGGRGRFFVRSEWREPDRMTPIDLYLEEVDGQWRWVAAMHTYQRADLVNGNCVPYRSPWVSTTGTC
jgi:hypothetical protein